MDYNQKKYQILKTKRYLKNYDFFFMYHSIKLNSTESLHIEQKLKKLKLEQYKMLNGISSKTFLKSILKNYSKLICGLVVTLKPELASSEISFNKLEKELKTLFILLSIKLNNKIYFSSQVTKMKTFSFKKNVFNLYKILEF